MLKEAEPARLLTAIHAVAAGDMLFAPAVTRRLVEAYVDRYRPPADHPPASRLHPLTAREREILTLVGTGISNTDIAQRLTITEGTVKTHLNRIMSKLGLASRAQAVVIAYETGLVSTG